MFVVRAFVTVLRALFCCFQRCVFADSFDIVVVVPAIRETDAVFLESLSRQARERLPAQRMC